jgi:hypothetical protein
MTVDRTHDLIDRYIGLESVEVIEEVLAVCGANIDARAIPLLKRRLDEERGRALELGAQGYTRMAEKSAQMIACLTALITMLGEG